MPLGTNDWYATSDPGEVRLGSGGGTAHLLVEAWRGDRRGHVVFRMAARVPKTHDPRRRAEPTTAGVRRDRQALSAHAGIASVVRAAAGSDAAGLPKADLPGCPGAGATRLRCHGHERRCPCCALALCRRHFRMWIFWLWAWRSRLETAQGFGVFFSTRENPREVAFFRQKPSVQAIHDLASTHTFLVDTGIWLLSERAVGRTAGEMWLGCRAAAFQRRPARHLRAVCPVWIIAGPDAAANRSTRVDAVLRRDLPAISGVLPLGHQPAAD